MKHKTSTVPASSLQSAIYILQNPESSWVKSPEERAKMTLACKDGDNIPKVKDAGKTKKIGDHTIQLMHNGIMVLRDGYQGKWETAVIEGLNGVHEPQEELVFYEVLKRVKQGGKMLELGSWWSFYSMWFLKETNGVAYCTEPDPDNLLLGKSNAKLNGFTEGKDIHFRQYASGDRDGRMISFKTESQQQVRVPIRTVDSVIEEEGIDLLSVLHFDIQGAEVDTLNGALESIKKGKIRFVFVSTHHYSISGDPLTHQKCIDFLRSNGAHIIAKHTVLESCSGDGLIVASFDPADKDFSVKVSLQPTDESLFRQAEIDTAILWREYEKVVQSYKLLDTQLAEQEQRLLAAKDEVNDLKNFIEEITPLKKHLKRQVKVRIKSQNPK